jgi:hypothetical protein
MCLIQFQFTNEDGKMACCTHERSAYTCLVGNSEGKSPLGRPAHRWEDNIKLGLKETTMRVWIGLKELRIVTSSVLL